MMVMKDNEVAENGIKN